MNRFNLITLKGQPFDATTLDNRIVLIVNTASKCGFKKQFFELEKIYQTFKAQGLVILGFPCDQFAHQELPDAEAIAYACERDFGVSFPMMGLTKVRGTEAAPLFKWLTAQAPGILGTSAIKWNFTKFLYNPKTQKVTRYAPATAPHKIIPEIKRALASLG